MKLNHNVLLVMNFLFFGCVYYTGAQTQTANYSFIKKQFNHLYYSKDSSAFINFFQTLDKVTGKEFQRVNIVHMGGSHIQAGVWSHAFLTNFQKTFITAGGGFFGFPYRMAKTNGQPYMTSFTNGNWKRCRPIGKEFCLPLGMSALSMSTNDSANFFGFNLTRKSTFRYGNIVRVYHNFNASFEFALDPQAIKIERQDFPKSGYTQFRFDVLIDSVAFNLIKRDTLVRDFTLYGFTLESDLTSGFFLAGLGANGASSSSFLQAVDLVPQLGSLNADLYILSLGVNDTQSKGFTKDDYIENYDTLITQIKAASPNAAIILTTTTDNYIRRKTSNKRTIKARDAMFELMHKHNVAVWDLFSLMGGYKSMTQWYKKGLANRDKVHFNNRGYVLLGDLMFEAVYKSYMNNKPKN